MGALSPDPHVVTPTNCYSTLSSAFLVLNTFLLRSEKNKYVTSADVLHLLLHLLFMPPFVDGRGGAKYFLPQGAGYPSYATASDLPPSDQQHLFSRFNYSYGPPTLFSEIGKIHHLSCLVSTHLHHLLPYISKLFERLVFNLISYNLKSENRFSSSGRLSS